MENPSSTVNGDLLYLRAMQPRNFDGMIFSATLAPHRSLGRSGFLVLMGAIAGLWFLTGVFFWSLGAWPVIGFFGLDFLAVWLAFELNYRAARAYEEVAVSRTELVIRKVAPNGRAQEFRFNPAWVRLEVETITDEGVKRVTVRSRDRRVAVGSLLHPEDRKSFARALAAALATSRN
jgi:uncharacterized membrane protein